MFATVLFMLWNMPDTLLKVGASTFFTAATMFTLILVTGALVGDIAAALWKWFAAVISGAPQ